MHVTLCVDALSPQLSGIGRYTWELCKGLAARKDLSSLRFYAGNSLIEDPSQLLSHGYDRRRYPRLLRSAHRWHARTTLRRTLVHGPNYFLPPDAERGIITVHDLSIFRYPETHPESRIKFFERQFSLSLARAVQIITDTETIRQDVIDAFSVPPECVTAVPLGVDGSFHPMDKDEIADAIAPWSLTPGEYGLSVAAFEPRKRIADLIGAWGRLPLGLRRAYPLVLAGTPGWRNDDLNKEIFRAQCEGWVKQLGFVPETRLPFLYAGARVFVYPSIYEGFGLPPVEAMASGVPVIVSGRSCLAEVCGNAARFIDPDDEEGFAEAIEASLSDEQWRSEIIIKGLERARRFTWDRCVEETVAVYDQTWR